MPLSSTKKVPLVTYNFVGSVEICWRNTKDRYVVYKGRRPERGIEMSWPEFTQFFSGAVY